MEKKIAILGAGESGVGAALLAKQKGYAVWVSDKGNIDTQRKEILNREMIPFEEGMHSEIEILSCSEIIKSPGISDKAPIVKAARERNIPVIDELEFAYRFSKGKVIAITGTNGKTTTTLLTYHLLKKGGVDVGLGGNVGQSWAGQLVQKDHEWWVLETSSFQIDGFREMKPAIGILTNITPDHLDRYDYAMEKYVASKISLFRNMDESGAAIYFLDDQYIPDGLKKVTLKAKTFPVSIQTQIQPGGYFDGNSIHLSMPGKKIKINKEDIVLKGTHNMLNTMCATLAASIAGVPEESIRQSLKDFENAAHRMEPVAVINGVSFINDSKGTNVDATFYALSSYENPVIWIAGGVDKGNDYSVLYPEIKGKVKMLICLGVDNQKLKSAFEGRIAEIKETQNVEEAVKWGLEYGKEGDVVLLSPACASFDLFKNYEDRGEQYKSAVNRLKLLSA
ncbi:UDP-N-acetylmuramoyl-L-alanine--D-glutamate ligase [Shivajiella indica]|uniref:UDP-N-acetylmuramoylalanine--D-glutamate ligase n=1 Tax=Shivajiella indica TaxID=872115 RepID=A0ABW5B9Y2_9BACT